MDNQQPKVSEQEYGWFAGFFDGEGMITFAVQAKAGKNGAPKVHPYLILSATDTESLNTATSILDRAGLAYHVSWVQPKGQTRGGRPHKAAWRMEISGFKRGVRFLMWLTPALRTKHKKADLVLAYAQKRQAHSDFRTPITPDEWELVLEMRRLNDRGVGPSYLKAMKLNTERPGASSEQLAANGRKGAEARWGIRD